MKPDANVTRYNRAFDRVWRELKRFMGAAEECGFPLRRVTFERTESGGKILRTTNRRIKK